MDWIKIKTEYVTTTISYRELSKKYNVPFNTLQCRARKENWVDLRKKHQDNIVTKYTKKVESKAIDYKSALYDLAYKIAMQLVDMTEDNTITDLIKRGIKPRDITGAIKDLGDIFHVKSDVDLLEQEARIEKLRKEAQSDRNEDNTIKVVISNDAEEYSK